ncbi:membrane protein [Caballeronia mineralivorans PML1(12)]|uniref:Membrane protein n=1 Tax=Caballeronia mineralivorans PML1(12) TaxID=908627 RepID=A0A0J1CNN1_9BURK|nr:membrane protein [Caballeronia mineralivorans]KLU22159.1 membrane protein [Caballeronia mineralivorans PML1(12)]
MSLIIAGRFQTFPKAEAAAQRLFARGFLEEDVTLFYVAPSGQHGLIGTGGGYHADASAQEVSKGAGKGVTIGAVLGAIVGAALFVLFKAPWLAAVLAAGAGAYVGSLVGAMVHARSGTRTAARTRTAAGTEASTGNHGSANAVDPRHSGVVVAVHVAPELQAEAAAILRDAGGKEVERASGQWRNGRWADFDPVKPPEPVREFAEPRA